MMSLVKDTIVTSLRTSARSGTTTINESDHPSADAEADAGTRRGFVISATSKRMEASSPAERQSSRSSDSNLASQAKKISSRKHSLHDRTLAPSGPKKAVDHPKVCPKRPISVVGAHVTLT